MSFEGGKMKHYSAFFLLCYSINAQYVDDYINSNQLIRLPSEHQQTRTVYPDQGTYPATNNGMDFSPGKN